LPELQGASLALPWVLPFVLLVAAMAMMPLFAASLWDRAQHMFVIGLVAVVLLAMTTSFGLSETAHVALKTVIGDYIPFVLLLTALFVTAGGIVVRGNLRGTPMTNATLLAIGIVLANLVGTTGASIILIRPLLRANDDRPHNAHVIVFFIFLVSNIGGSLSPLGDPPLFLGYLHGVDFFWPAMHLLPLTLTAAAGVLVIFLAVDLYFYRREGRLPRDPTPARPITFAGILNILLVVAIVAGVILTGTFDLGRFTLWGLEIEVSSVARDAVLLVATAISLRWTPPLLRQENGFTWGPLREVAILFAAIFITLIPVTAMLSAGASGAFAPLIASVMRPDGSLENVALFWVTGALSSFLDNAPTYLVFFELAGGNARHLMAAGATSLIAISAGAVFMGANSYIGNAPNLMVYAIARQRKVRMPGFFAYMAWSVVVLLPIFGLLSLLFLNQ
jgi:Na+/H+ antiporter NhaD/arsenite permease-like protein